MNFHLKKIELHIEDELLELAEQYLDQGKLKALFEVDKHLWLAKVEAGGTYEVEVQITPTKVKAYTCECEDFFANGICGHISAVLLALLRRLEFVEQKKKNIKKLKNVPKKLTTAIIVDNISHDELKTFIRIYARTNRNFAIALKTRFARSVTSIDDNDKYLQLLDTTINSIKRNSTKIHNKGLQRLTNALSELHIHASDAIALKNYAEAFAIVQAIIIKTAPLIKLIDYQKDSLIETLGQSFDLIASISKHDVAPQLKKTIWNFCMSECTREVYLRNGMEHMLFDILYGLQASKNQITEFLQQIDSSLTELDNHQTAPKYYQQAKISLLTAKLYFSYQINDTFTIESTIKENLDFASSLHEAIKVSIVQNNLQQAKSLAHTGLALFENNTVVIPILDEQLLNIALKEKDTKAILNYSKNCFLNTMDIEYFHLYKKGNKNWDKRLENLITSIDQEEIDPDKRNQLLAMIYAEELLLQKLIKHIEAADSLTLLEEYSPLLLDHHKEATYLLHEQLIKSYLSSHVGRQASMTVSFIIQRLHNKGEHKLSNKLVKMLRTEYAERNSLMQELQV